MPQSDTTITPVIDVDVTFDGSLPGAGEYARRKIGSLARFADASVTDARVRLTARTHDQVVAQANLGIDGRRIRAQAEAPTVYEAVDALQDSLRRILRHRPRLSPSRRGFMHAAGQQHTRPPFPHWSTGDDDTRQLTRRKSFSVARLTVSEAAEELDLFDYHFHLFTEQSTGLDSVLYRSGPTGYRLVQTEASLPASALQLPALVTVSPTAPPELTVADAIERLDALRLPFLFFVDLAQCRGSVLYQRYDGQYGLITPAAEGMIVTPAS
jgi:ribosome-associated translation inhibitor RaiA